MLPQAHRDNLKIKRAAGCVVYRREADQTLWLLLILDRYGRWTVPKGHLKNGEDEAAAAIREVFEETGIRGELGPPVARIEYVVRSKRGQPRRKQVAFFLLYTDETELNPQAAEGISAAEWCAPDVALTRIGYPQVREVAVRALEILS
jgi:8-oxo-dGTP pyrophosphatase MutT (NUDIX family)